MVESTRLQLSHYAQQCEKTIQRVCGVGAFISAFEEGSREETKKARRKRSPNPD